MRTRVGLFLIAIAFISAGGQAPAKPDPNSAPCTVEPQPDPCGATPSAGTKPSAAEKFPFPGEPVRHDAATPSLSGVPAAPEATAAPATKKAFPFPGDATPGSVNPPEAGSSSSSSSSSGDTPQYDPAAGADDPVLTDKGSQGAPAPTGRHLLHRVNPVGTKLQSIDERESEDLDIAHFYLQSGDVKGAYLRSQDAVKTAPDDPGAHYMLAETARRLNKRDEAIAEYNACLKLDPTEKQAKDAHKALDALKP
jgi:Tetratricopeptide repeat